jgi:hypothetical protein
MVLFGRLHLQLPTQRLEVGLVEEDVVVHVVVVAMVVAGYARPCHIELRDNGPRKEMEMRRFR